MIHEVIAEVDMGAPIVVREIPLREDAHGDLHSLEQHIHQVEWEAVVQALALIIQQSKKDTLVDR